MDTFFMELFADLWEDFLQELIAANLLDAIKEFSKKDWSDKIEVNVILDKDTLEEAWVEIRGLDYLIFKDKGVKRQPMKWLKGKTLPIKIKNNKVQIVFNEPPDFFTKINKNTFDKDSLYNKVGKKFWHPGYAGIDFVKKAVEKAVEEFLLYLMDFKNGFNEGYYE